MRRAGQNPTESETQVIFPYPVTIQWNYNSSFGQDMVNKIDDGSSSLNFEVKSEPYCPPEPAKLLHRDKPSPSPKSPNGLSMTFMNSNDHPLPNDTFYPKHKTSHFQALVSFQDLYKLTLNFHWTSRPDPIDSKSRLILILHDSVLCQDFCLLMSEKTKDKEMDTETHFKDTFRVFSKDEEGWSNMKTYRMSQKCPFIAL